MKKIGLLTVLLMLPFLAGCGTTGGRYPDADKYLVGNQVYEENITKLDVDWVSGSVTFVEDITMTGVKVEEEENSYPDAEKVHSYLNEGELKIKFFASGHYSGIAFNSSKKNLTLTYNPLVLKSIFIDITSGKVNAASLTASEKIGFDLTSGSVNIGTVTTGAFTADMTSGNLTIEHALVNKYDVDLTSGRIDTAFDTLSEGKVDATSGTISLKMPEVGGATVTVKKTSGYVSIRPEHTMPSNNTYVIGEGLAKMDIHMTSGTLLIY